VFAFKVGFLTGLLDPEAEEESLFDFDAFIDLKRGEDGLLQWIGMNCKLSCN
jgi:hypothetical protein